MIFDDIDKLINDSFLRGNQSQSSCLKLLDGERRDVGILFADVNGFTAISEKLDPEKIRLLADKLMQVLTACVKNYGGYVDKYEGDRIMALFGAKKASERDAERAIMSGFEMIDKVATFNRIIKNDDEYRDFNISLRVGINYGLVTTGKIGEKREGDFTVYGDSVNIASRLEERAPLNRILVPNMLANSLTDCFEFEPFGDLKLKGKSKKIETSLIKGIKKCDFRGDNFFNTFVDREKELSDIRETINKSKTTKSGFSEENRFYFIFISGPSGIGKSRLVNELIKSDLNGEEILFGICSMVKKTRFGFVDGLIREKLGINIEDRREEVEKKISNWIHSCMADERIKHEMIGLFFAKERDVQSYGNSENDFISSRQALVNFIKATAQHAFIKSSSLIVIVEDFHESDESDVSALKSVLDALKFRSEDEHTGSYVFIFTSRDKNHDNFGLSGAVVKKIEMEPLNETYSEKLIDSVTGKNIFEDVIKNEIIRKAEGNPLFLVELCKLAKSIKRNDFMENDTFPSSLKSLMLSRLDNFEEEKRILLQVLSVSGEHFENDLIDEVVKTIGFRDETASLLTDLENEVVIYRTEKSVFRFSSMFFRDAVYETLLIENRKIIHKAYAEAMIRKRQNKNEEYCSEICRHYLKTDESERKIEYLEKAGEGFKKRFEILKARKYFGELDKILRDKIIKEGSYKSLYVKNLLDLSGVQSIIGERESSEANGEISLKIIRENDYKEYEGEALENLARIKLNLNKTNEADVYIEEALEIYKKNKKYVKTVNVESLKGESLFLKNRFVEALDCFTRNLRSARSLKNDDAMIKAYFNMARVYLRMNGFLKSLTYNLKAFQLSEKNNDKLMMSRILPNLGICYRNLNRIDEAFEVYERSLKMAKETGDKKMIATVYGNLSVLYLKNEDFKKYMECLRKQMLLNFELHDKIGMAYALAGFGNYHSFLGKNHEAVVAYNKSAEIASDLSLKILQINSFYNLASLYFKMEKMTEAHEYIEKSEKTASEIGNREWIFMSEIVKRRIEFLTAKNSREKLTYFKETEKMLDTYTNREARAEVLYRLWEFCLTGQGSIGIPMEKTEKYRKEALKLIYKINKKKKRKDYEFKLRNLEKGAVIKDEKYYSLY